MTMRLRFPTQLPDNRARRYKPGLSAETAQRLLLQAETWRGREG